MRRFCLPALVLALSSFMTAQDGTVRGTINLIHHSKNEASSSDVLVWLSPTGSSETVSPGPTTRLVQKNKRFTPHLLAVTVGNRNRISEPRPLFS